MQTRAIPFEWNAFGIDSKFGDVEPLERVVSYLDELTGEGQRCLGQAKLPAQPLPQLQTSPGNVAASRLQAAAFAAMPLMRRQEAMIRLSSRCSQLDQPSLLQEMLQH